MIKLWDVTGQSLSNPITTPTLTLEGHSKRILGNQFISHSNYFNQNTCIARITCHSKLLLIFVALKFNPFVSNLLLSAGSDDLRIWDLLNGKEVTKCDPFGKCLTQFQNHN